MAWTFVFLNRHKCDAASYLQACNDFKTALAQSCCRIYNCDVGHWFGGSRVLERRHGSSAAA